MDPNTERYIQDCFGSCSPEPACDYPLADRCLQAAKMMPLTHGLASIDFVESWSEGVGAPPELLSPKQLGNTNVKPFRRHLRTDNDVFFWVGPLRIPSRMVALIFKASIENDVTRASATPWDSGGAYRTRYQFPERAKQLVHERMMGVPDYRQALAATIYLRHDEPQGYVDARLLRTADPDQVVNVLDDHDPSSFTYELRIPDRVSIVSPHLTFVAVDTRYARRIDGFREWCKKNNVKFVEVGVSKGRKFPHASTTEAVVDYVKGQLP